MAGNAQDATRTQVNAVSVALVRAGRILLVQRARPPYRGMWTLPGGRVEPDETPEQAARREIEEELGLRVEALSPLTQLTVGTPVAWRLQVFVAPVGDGEIRPSDEIGGWQWHGRDLGRLTTTPGLAGVVGLALDEIESE